MLQVRITIAFLFISLFSFAQDKPIIQLENCDDNTQIRNEQCYTDGVNQYTVYTDTDSIQRAYNVIDNAEFDITDGLPFDGPSGNPLSFTQAAGSATTIVLVPGIGEMTRQGDLLVATGSSQLEWRNDGYPNFQSFDDALENDVLFTIIGDPFF